MSGKFTPKCSHKLNTWPVLSPWLEAVYELNYLGGGPLQGHSLNTVAALGPSCSPFLEQIYENAKRPILFSLIGRKLQSRLMYR